MIPQCRQYINSRLSKWESGRAFGLGDFMWERSQMGEIRKIMRDKLEDGEVKYFLDFNGKPMSDMWVKV